LVEFGNELQISFLYLVMIFATWSHPALYLVCQSYQSGTGGDRVITIIIIIILYCRENMFVFIMPCAYGLAHGRLVYC
jgi:hypothetical protein